MSPFLSRPFAVAAALASLIAVSTRCGTGTNVCDETVAPGAACSDPKLCCSLPNSECGGCQCNGSTFVCDMGACSPVAHCPEPSTLLSGNQCGHPSTEPVCAYYPPSPSSCPSTAPIFPCGATCSCSAPAFTRETGVWSCTPTACDAGSD